MLLSLGLISTACLTFLSRHTGDILVGFLSMLMNHRFSLQKTFDALFAYARVDSSKQRGVTKRFMRVISQS